MSSKKRLIVFLVEMVSDFLKHLTAFLIFMSFVYEYMFTASIDAIVA